MVTDDGAMLMDSVTVLLHRLGVAYLAIMNPVFHVRRDGAGDLLAVGPKDSGDDGIDETWIHVQLVAVGGPQRLSMKPSVCCRGCSPTCAESQRIRRR